MHVEIFCLCDAATDYAGKLNVLGAYDTILSTGYPLRLKALIYAMRLRLRHDEAGVHNIALNTINYDGKNVLPPFTAQISATSNYDVDSAAFNVVVSAENVVFDQPGIYRIDLEMDGKVLSSLPLTIESAMGK